MLLELVVENYALMDRLRVQFHEGFHVLTGETGSGKSLLVDALGLLLGGRASAEMVRTGAERARVSGLFRASKEAGLTSILESSGIETDDGELLVEREVLAGGGSRAFVQSRPVTVALLKELAPFFGDIHGQHDQQRLFDGAAQLDLLDEFSASDTAQARVAASYDQWRVVSQELADLERSGQERLRMTDLWTFQRREIESSVPKAGEDIALEAERHLLSNVERLRVAADAAYESLYESPAAALTQIRGAVRRIEELARLDPSLQSLIETLQPAEIAVREASYTLRDYMARLEADPARLEAVESRLAALDKLKRKYGSTLDDVLLFLEEVRRNLDAVENSEERRAELTRRRDALAAEYEAAAAELTRLRTEAARKLEKKVEVELAQLAMERTVFRVRMSAAAWSAKGSDAAAFLVSANVGEEPKPLDKVASGGELSRIALALKTCVTSRASKRSAARTLVFDEVDAGIGGRAAETVGRRLKQLTPAGQVLCVTHLAQIAGFADHHYAVEKRTVKGRTVASIEKLEGAPRTREIGRMLAGDRLTEEALRHAEQLIRLSAG